MYRLCSTYGLEYVRQNMKKMKLRAGEIVQIDPKQDDHFGGCFLTITEIFDDTVRGFIKLPGDAYKKTLEYPFEALQWVGRAVWNIKQYVEEI